MQSVAGLILGAVLVAWGMLLDRSTPLAQGPLFAALQLASLGGTGLGVLAGLSRMRGPRERLALGFGALVGWRLAYFPVMVFSGHLASIGEWVLLGLGAPVVVYPAFLLVVATIHLAAAAAVGFLIAPPRLLGVVRPALVRVPLLAAFAVALLVSFNSLEDLHPLPDRYVALDAAPPPLRAGTGNPYLTALTAPGYLPNQRVVLLAAGLTYDTIPPSPWARAVRSVLEHDFRANPHGGAADRVREHYLSYHSAHALIGCRGGLGCGSAPPAKAP